MGCGSENGSDMKDYGNDYNNQNNVLRNKDMNSDQKCHSTNNSQIPRHIQEDINQLSYGIANKENNNSMNICYSNSQSKSDRGKKSIFKENQRPSDMLQNVNANLNAKQALLSKKIAQADTNAVQT